MFARVHFPEMLGAEELDHYLEQGWFRMGQSIFTTNFLSFKDEFYSAIWLRADLKKFTVDKTQNELLKRNRKFRTEIRPSTLTREQEDLYSKYTKGISFDTSPTLHQLLFRNASHSIFNTFEINVYDDDKLIASGFFDIGKHAAEGIASVYDPAYKKYSLGKYLIYQKINHCKELRLDYFYPGYFVPGYAFFDYKLSIGKDALEYLQYNTNQWRPIGIFSHGETPLYKMTTGLTELKQRFDHAGIKSHVVRYAYFDANLIPELKDADLLDHPVFLLAEHQSLTDHQIITYNVTDRCYHLLMCDSFWTSPASDTDARVFAKHLLKVREDVLRSDNPDQFVKRFAAFENRT